VTLHQRIRSKRRVHTAFTLLEVVLTLAMSVVLMVLIGGAIQFYSRDMSLRDLEIRQTLLAVAVMQMIEDDLRSTIHPRPADTTPMKELLAATSAADSGAGAAVSGSGGLSAAGLESETEVTETTATDLQSGVAVLETPGLIGNQTQIQIDQSRLPRLEEYVAMLDQTTTDIEDIPSDLKTVAYFVQQEGIGVEDELGQIDSTSQLGTSGLVRRSLDHAATVEAALNGSLTLLNQTGELLAPEITGIEFSYWDGLTWQIEWSSDTYDELPLAVQVTISMIDPSAQITGQTLSLSGEDSVRTFTHIIRLPLAQPLEDEEEDLSGAGL
jgi:type II secretory pathway component PulJ